MSMQHFLAAEQLIIETLQSAVPGLAQVGGWSTMESALEGVAQYPAALVVYDGDTGADTRGNTGVTTQRWVVIIIDYAPQTQGSQSGARATIGPLITSTIGALNGAELDEGWLKLKFAGGVTPKYMRGGIAAFAIPFHVARPL